MSGGVGAAPPPCGPQAAPDTSLEPRETTDFIDECDETQCSRFRHAGWMPVRKKVLSALVRTGQPTGRRQRFCTCGMGGRLMKKEVEYGKFTYRVFGSYCHDRLCTPCANARSLILRSSLMHRLETANGPISFITLTLHGGKNEPLRDAVTRLLQAFKVLRQMPLWANAVKGGGCFLELKRSDRLPRWHPHLHILAEAKFMDQAELSRDWYAATGDSYIVDVRRVKDLEHVGNYVTKYASKPLNSTLLGKPELLDEAVAALKGRRLCLCFGSWYGKPLIDDFEDDPTLPGWEEVCGLATFMQACNSQEGWAINILTAMHAQDAWRMSLESGP